VQNQKLSAVEIQYVAGYGSAATSVPEGIRQAILLAVGHWYENREQSTAKAMQELPLGARHLLAAYDIGEIT
jgi:uncharacterized phiE125 gp8 family phage protein